MKRLMTSAVALSLLASGAALAQNQPRGDRGGDRPSSSQGQGGGGQFQGGRQGGGGARPDGGGAQGQAGGGFQRGDLGQDRPQQQPQAQQPVAQQPQAQPQQAQQPRQDRDDRPYSRPGALNDNRPTTPNGAPNPNRGPDRPDNRNDNRGPDRGNQNGGINPDPRYDPRNNNNRGPDRNDNRGGYDNRGPGSRPPVGRPNDPRDRNRPQYDARRYRPSYQSPQRYRGPAWRPPIGYYAYNWRFGDYLPNSWFGSSYYLNWGVYGLPMPPLGCEWVRVGDDALLVDRFTGRVLSVYYDLFW